MWSSSTAWEPPPATGRPSAAAGTGYRGSTVDLLGFAHSPSPPDATYDIECHLAAVEAHLPARAVVVAHSPRPPDGAVRQPNVVTDAFATVLSSLGERC